ncbi:MAG: polysaccharide biosynthesis tyrosine autokinase [Calditrichaeota bacterium]|nr:MAG: polysaccharide biosynthesis tyrosine autokinase [Calditrichota bacterium]
MENFAEFQENEQQISLQDYLRILYRGRWIILTSFVVVVLATAYFTFTATPVYEATAKILIEDKNSMEKALFDINYLGNQSTVIQNQLEILKSRTLAERVVLRLQSAVYRDSLEIFQPDENGDYMVLRDQVDWILDRLTVTPKQETEIIHVTFQARSPFEAARICNEVVVTYQQLSKEVNLSEFKDLRQFLELQLRKKSEELKQSEEALRLYREREKLVSLEESTKELISQLAESQAELEASMVELESLQEQKRNLEKQLEERRKALSSEVTQVSSPLLVELQQEYARMVNDKVKYEALIAQDHTIDPQEYQMELLSRANRIKAIQKRLQEEAQRIANTSMVSDPLQIAQELITTKLQLETQIKGLRAKMDALRDVVQQYESQLEVLPSQGLELARLERQVQVDQNTFILLTQKLEETKIAEAGQRETIRIVDPAIEPKFPVSPKKKLNLLLGAVIGIGLGIGLTILLEFFDDSIKNPDELERMGLPILSIIPQISQDELSRPKVAVNGNGELNEGEVIESQLITHFDPKSPISEAYRTLRTNIQFQNLGTDNLSLLVTSSAPKEGKSTTLANLAITMAQMGSRVLIVDTDLRRPVVHSIFKLKKDKGITNYLMGKLPFEDIVKPSFVENLYIVTSGPLPPNPSELLASEAMENFVQEARNNFDVVLFDSPPIIAVTDAALLSSKVEGVILVIRAHQTQKEAVKRAKTLLDNVHARIIGCLLNSVDIERAYGSYYYYYYYHYYSYYGHDLKRRKRTKIT